VVLIVCEGEKTEPNYLRGLRNMYNLSSVNVRIVPPPGSDPLSIVKFAIGELKRDPEYDRAYCIFDRDGHATFNAAIRRIRQSPFSKSKRLTGITSIPCFEIWLLLHYRYTDAPYSSVGGNSACDLVIRDLRVHFPEYSKAHRSIFAELGSRFSDASRHAKRLEAQNAATGANNPATQMHDLVDYLIGLKQGAKRGLIWRNYEPPLNICTAVLSSSPNPPRFVLTEHPATVSLAGLGWNLLWVTIGNAIAGAGIMGLGYWAASRTPAAAPATASLAAAE
jgi:hypothetical protein